MTDVESFRAELVEFLEQAGERLGLTARQGELARGERFECRDRLEQSRRGGDDQKPGVDAGKGST